MGAAAGGPRGPDGHGGDGLAAREAGLAVEDVCPGKDAVGLAMETFTGHPELAAAWGELDPPTSTPPSASTVG
ncbi:hypothetical protein NKH77_04200 [Streptomyces sp. M19]